MQDDRFFHNPDYIHLQRAQGILSNSEQHSPRLVLKAVDILLERKPAIVDNN
jgi:hypothetical protein